MLADQVKARFSTREPNTTHEFLRVLQSADPSCRLSELPGDVIEVKFSDHSTLIIPSEPGQEWIVEWEPKA